MFLKCYKNLTPRNFCLATLLRTHQAVTSTLNYVHGYRFICLVANCYHKNCGPLIIYKLS